MKQSKLTRRGLMLAGTAAAIGGAAHALKISSGPGMNFTRADATMLTRGNSAEPDTLDPHKAEGSWENNIIGDMFIGLMTDGPDGAAIPGAAESFTVSADGLTYIFNLRDHTWSDGKPVTAHDFVFSFRRVANPKTAAQYASILYPLKNMQQAAAGHVPPEAIGARALDDRTLELTFQFQVPYIRELLTHYTTFAVPQHVVEMNPDNWTRPEHIVVNGPYVLKKWIPNEYIQLEKNPHFFDSDNVAVKTVYFYPTPDSAAALKRFRSGDLDLVWDSVPPHEFHWLQLHLAREFHLSPFVLSQYVTFNMRRKPFNDLRVRKALSLGIDREILVAKVTRAGERPSYALVPSGIPNYSSAQLKFRTLTQAQRIADARKLLHDAGFGPANPLTFDLSIINSTAIRIASVALQGMWNEIGVKARLVPSDSPIHYNLLRKHDFSAAWDGWIADYRDAKTYLTLFQTATTDLNYGVYSNPEFDALVNQSDLERNPETRANLLRRAEQIVLDDVAIAPMYFGVTRNLVSPQVKGWIDNNVNVHRTRYLSLDRDIKTV